MLGLYRTIWRRSWRGQLVIIGLSVLIAALAAAPLEFQKRIVNDLATGLELGELLLLGAGMIGVVLASLALKYLLGMRASLLGEDTVRILRTRAYEGHLGAAAADASDVAPRPVGTLVNMVSTEAEDLGQFVGRAFADPVMQIGTLVSVTAFIFASQPLLGVIALLVITPQAAIVLWTQRRVNTLVGERIRLLRAAADRMTADGIRAFDRAVVEDIGAIFDTRRRIFRWKLSTKFAVSALGAAGTVGILMLGGYLVIEGRTDVGTVVAASIALTRLQGPWTALVAFYRQASPMRVRFELFRGALAAR